MCDEIHWYSVQWFNRIKVILRPKCSLQALNLSSALSTPKMPKIACQYLNSSKQTGWHGIMQNVILEFSK